MNDNLIPFRPSMPARPDTAIYTGPDDVVGDPNLTIADKRAILASWASDARAVEDARTLRRLDIGAVVEVDAVLEALRGLDGYSTAGAHARRASTNSRGGAVVVRLPLRDRGSRSFDDDDPPPTPTMSAILPRPIRVSALGVEPKLAAARA